MFPNYSITGGSVLIFIYDSVFDSIPPGVFGIYENLLGFYIMLGIIVSYVSGSRSALTCIESEFDHVLKVNPSHRLKNAILG